MAKDLLRLNLRIDEDLRRIVDEGRVKEGLDKDSDFIRWLIREYGKKLTKRLTDEQFAELLDLLKARMQQ